MGARAVFVELCDMANDSGNCFPSRKTLAERINMSTDSVDRFLDELTAIGLVTRTRRTSPDGDYTSSLYQLMVLPHLSAPILGGIGIGTATGMGTDAHLTVSSVLTQTTELLIVPETEKEKRPTYSEIQGYDTKATQRLLKQSEEFIGHKWTAEGKQKRFIADVLRAGFSEEKAWECFVSLGDDEFWGQKGYDWATVCSQIGKVKKKKQPIKSYGVKK